MILSLLAISAAPLKAQEAVIADLVVANSKSDLVAFFNIKDAVSDELKNGVQHGIPITFTFEIVLEMRRNNWPDKTIYSGSFVHSMAYDNLKKEYTVSQNEHEKLLTTIEFDKAMQLMCEVNGVTILPLAELKPDRQYLLKAKATLEKTTLPLNFHYIIPFTEFWDLKTDWAVVEFIY